MNSIPQFTTDKDFLTGPEMDALLKASKKSRYPIRDYIILLMMYRHGLRVSELINIKLKDLNLQQSSLWVNRLKNGLSGNHPIKGDELRAIKRYLKTRSDQLPYLFINERGNQFTRQAINYIINQAAKRAKLDNVHPHTMRHSCGFYLANRGVDLRVIQDYLGHRDPKHTVLYTKIAGIKFEGLWD